MHSQLEDNTRLSKLLLKDAVTNQDVCEFLDETWNQRLQFLKKNGKEADDSSNPYSSLRKKLFLNEPLTSEEIITLQEVLQNVNKLFRVFGKKAVGFSVYMQNLDNMLKALASNG